MASIDIFQEGKKFLSKVTLLKNRIGNNRVSIKLCYKEDLKVLKIRSSLAF